MTANILNIIGIIGIVLLILLGILLAGLLSVLFIPIGYRLQAEKKEERITLQLKLSWLAGLVRFYYGYPEPAKGIGKVLCFTVYDSKKRRKQDSPEDSDIPKTEAAQEPPIETQPADNLKQENPKQDSNTTTFDEATSNNLKQESPKRDSNTTTFDETASDNLKQDNPKQGSPRRIWTKYHNSKYTFLKICDKMKYIASDIAFYKELLQDEQTKELLQYGLFRLGRIWKNIRPRTLQGEILYGADSPDTTGYVLAVYYSMFFPGIGKHIHITPDFTQPVLEGSLLIAGHVTVFQAGYHSLRFLWDKRLQLLRNRLAKHKQESKKQSNS